ncbi:putative senescence regulator S40 [Helianthus anomalus]
MEATNSYSYFTRPNYSHVVMNGFIESDSSFELDESDVWNVSVSPELRKTSSRITKSSSVMAVKRGTPVSVPGWCKIVKEDYIENRRRYGDYSDNNSVEDRIPPHEFLARKRMASFSVHEGIGRTLKGRDLSRVRNAIWEKTGFED